MNLKYYDQFKQILADYQMSDRAKGALKDLKLVLMAAPTSTGRNTMIRELLKTDKYYFIVSDTTRPPQFRDGKMEENSIEYFFRNEEDFLSDLKAGEFLEAAIIHEQQVSGVSIRELEKAKSHSKIAITDIEIVGVDNVMRAKPDSVAIFLLPPSFGEWQIRLNRRSKMSQQEIKNRLRGAKKELKAALGYDYYHFVIADELNRTVPLVDAIANGATDEQEQKKGRRVAEQLLKTLEEKLPS